MQQTKQSSVLSGKYAMHAKVLIVSFVAVAIFGNDVHGHVVKKQAPDQPMPDISSIVFTKYPDYRRVIGCRQACMVEFLVDHDMAEVPLEACKLNNTCAMCYDYCDFLFDQKRAHFKAMCLDEICFIGCKFACEHYVVSNWLHKFNGETANAEKHHANVTVHKFEKPIEQAEEDKAVAQVEEAEKVANIEMIEEVKNVEQDEKAETNEKIEDNDVGSLSREQLIRMGY